MKKILLTAAFAVAVASPAFAASSHYTRNSAANSAERSYASVQSPGTELQGQGNYAIDRNTVVFGDEVLGRDPDAFIRQQMLRTGNVNDASGNN